MGDSSREIIAVKDDQIQGQLETALLYLHCKHLQIKPGGLRTRVIGKLYNSWNRYQTTYPGNMKHAFFVYSYMRVKKYKFSSVLLHPIYRNFVQRTIGPVDI